MPERNRIRYNSCAMWPDAQDTQQLLKHARQGDGEAVNRLFERHRIPLRRMVEWRLDHAIRQRVDASDIVQEAMIEAHQRLKEYLQSPKIPFHLWLRLLARDHLIAAQRKHRVAQRRSVNREQSLADPAFKHSSSVELASLLAAKGLTPGADAIRRELEHRFHSALEELSEDDREILLMRHFEQLSNQEVAESLGLTEPAAGMRYLRALRRLRAVLGVDPEQAKRVE